VREPRSRTWWNSGGSREIRSHSAISGAHGAPTGDSRENHLTSSCSRPGALHPTGICGCRAALPLSARLVSRVVGPISASACDRFDRIEAKCGMALFPLAWVAAHATRKPEGNGSGARSRRRCWPCGARLLQSTRLQASAQRPCRVSRATRLRRHRGGQRSVVFSVSSTPALASPLALGCVETGLGTISA
jgi:hypothetical protein